MQITNYELKKLIEKYKDDTLLSMALSELHERRNADKQIAPPIPEPVKSANGKPFAFVDGSYNAKTNVYGYGGFVCVDGVRHQIQGSGTDPELASMHNVAGEIHGCLAALAKAKELEVTDLAIYYDYAGIEQWVTGSWKAKKPATQKYAATVKEYMKSMNITFVKVKGHSGVPGNELADKLAKEAVGIL